MCQACNPGFMRFLRNYGEDPGRRRFLQGAGLFALGLGVLNLGGFKLRHRKALSTTLTISGRAGTLS